MQDSRSMVGEQEAWWDVSDRLGSAAAHEAVPLHDDTGSPQAPAARSAAPLEGAQPAAMLAAGGGANFIPGTSGDDRLKGSKGDDEIVGGYGADRIKGGKGDDQINGGTAQRAIDDARERADIIKGGAGNDIIDGGGGDDVIKAGSGDDYVFGGYGGNDRIDGGSGNDRLGGGFAAGYGQALRDDDIIKGGKGQDIFEARFWDDASRPGGFDTPMLGPHEDTILDFRSGQDHLDIVVYRQNGEFTFRRGGFELFDSNEDGVLDGRDLFVDVAGKGKKATLTLDVGEALKSAGVVDQGELESGPHTLTLKKIASLDADDFVSTKTYVGRFGSSSGGSMDGDGRDEWLVGKEGNDILNGYGGDDLLTGGGGRNLFAFTYEDGDPGHDLIEDFARGSDQIAAWGRNGETLRFDMLDSNRDGILDGRDAAVRIEEQQLLAPGVTPTVGQTTVIDLDVAFGYSASFTGDNAVTLHGVTGLRETDFRDGALDSNVA
ncbi:calcium-binding protein [Geminicoccaceae bacterium 1502E]|nr:calcium-binding protein [Geminicoccaceae bacterium 1502E]